MKKQVLLTLIAITTALSFHSCDKIKEALLQAFTADGATFTFSVLPVNTTDTMLSIGVETIYFDLDSTVKAVTNSAFSLNDVSSVNPNEISLKILNPDSANNFANFQSGSLSFYSNNNTIPYDFNYVNANQYVDSINIPLDTTVNLKSYMMGNTFNYTLKGKLRKPITTTLNVRATVKFKVH